jgi:phosphoribosylformylglycinamidine synthase
MIVGICNGFQVLVRMGLLPFKQYGHMQATLTNNDSGHFECRWITMMIERSPCLMTRGLEGQEITLPIAHGEGKFFCDETTMATIEQHNLVALRYTYKESVTEQYPFNPNGSLHAIAGVCDETGRIFGMMPHPERFVERYHYPQWRSKGKEPQGLLLFKNVIDYYL